MNRTRIAAAVVSTAALGLFTLSSHAALVVWDGSEGNGLWTDGANWVGGSPPSNDDFRDTAVFDATTTPGTVTVPNGRKVNGIRFETVGWTIDVNGSDFDDLHNIFSTGAGVNRLDRFELRNNSNTGNWVIESGNTLELFNSYYARNRNASVSGGGLLLIDRAIDGFSSPQLRLNDITVRIDASTAFSSNNDGFVRFDHESAVLELKTTVANAQNQIDDEIIDNTGLGLQVTDIDGEFVRISVVPEPGSLILASAGALFLIGRQRRSYSSRPSTSGR